MLPNQDAACPMIAGILLAAGRSVRMGRNKLVLAYEGKAIVAHSLYALKNAGLSPVVCVLGWEAGKVRAAIRAAGVDEGVCFVTNESYATGRASSIRCGLASLPRESDAAVFLPADVPNVRARDVEALVERYEKTRAAIVAAVDSHGARTSPVLFSSALFQDLRALSGDVGGQSLIDARWESVERVYLQEPVPTDIDTPKDYEELKRGSP